MKVSENTAWRVVFVFCVLVVLLRLALACVPEASSAAETVPGRYLVKLRPGVAAPAGGDVIGGGWVVVSGSDEQAVASTYGKVADAVEPVYVVHSTEGGAAMPNDPLTGQLWALTSANVPAAWAVTHGQGKVVVTVFDTGVDASHPDLAGKVYGGKSYVTSDPGAWGDQQGHGTHVAGTVAARTNNGVGVPGIGYDVGIGVARVLGPDGSGDTAGIAKAIFEGADAVPAGWLAVFNFSLGCECPPPQVLADATRYAAKKDVVLVAAAGNSNADTTFRHFYPAGFTEFISVAAVDSGDNKASFSNYGGDIDLAAPGVGILSTMMRSGPLSNPTGYGQASGTSMASPHVAAIAALVRSAHPDWSAGQVRAALENTARKPAYYNRAYYGAGIVDAGRAVGGQVVLPRTPVPPGRTPTPVATPTPRPDLNFSMEVERLINVYRASKGLPALRHDDRLARAALAHNQYMDLHNCFAHVCAGEPDVFARFRAAGYPVLSGGENIARGYRTPYDVVMDGWRNSPGHNAALLNTYWPDFGCNYYNGANGNEFGNWWTCAFARSGGGKANDAPFLPDPLDGGKGR